MSLWREKVGTRKSTLALYIYSNQADNPFVVSLTHIPHHPENLVFLGVDHLESWGYNGVAAKI